MAKLMQSQGNWVIGDRFWNREKELELFTKRVDEGAHLLLVAQRRMGKTSLMQEAARRLKDKYICLFVDLQKSFNAAESIVELSLATQPHKSLWEKSKGIFSNILGNFANRIDKVEVAEIGVQLRAGITEGDWATKGNQLFSTLASSEKPVLLLMDEVPIMVNRVLKGQDFAITPERRARADEFMSWLRENSIRHKGKVRIVISGSIGFEPILRQAGLSATINTFAPFELPPWDKPTAVGCLEALGNQYKIQLGDGAAEAIAERLGCCIPHHVQMFFAHIHDRCVRRNRMEFAAGEVHEIYNTEMLSVRGHAELTHYEDRLKLVLGEEIFTLAIEMLTEAAVSGNLSAEAYYSLQKDYAFAKRTTKEVQEEIIRVLEHDGYLKQVDGAYVFISRLLKDWWKARHGFGFTPVGQREL